MKRNYPIYDQKYIFKIQRSEPEARLDVALEYLDEIIALYVRYGNEKKARDIVNVIREGKKGWDKICKRNIVVDSDVDNEYFLEPINYTDYLLSRFLRHSKDEEDYNLAKEVLEFNFSMLGYPFNEVGTWAEFNAEAEA